MRLYELVDRIDVIKDNIEHLDGSVWECDKDGECLADTESFKSLINFMEVFINNYK